MSVSLIEPEMLIGDISHRTYVQPREAVSTSAIVHDRDDKDDHASVRRATWDETDMRRFHQSSDMARVFPNLPHADAVDSTVPTRPSISVRLLPVAAAIAISPFLSSVSPFRWAAANVVYAIILPALVALVLAVVLLIRRRAVW